MVRLRSRKIRSPFLGAAASASAASAAGETASTPATSINTSTAAPAGATPTGNAGSHSSIAHSNNRNNHQREPGIGRTNTHHARQQHQRQRQVDDRRQRMRQSNHAGDETTSAANQRRPFESPGSPLSNSPAGPRRVASPGKRKPETRGITASIRRAKSAMFRMTSDSTASACRSSSSRDRPSSGGEAGGATGAPSHVAPADERMDTGDIRSDLDAEASQRSPAAAIPAAPRPAPPPEEDLSPVVLPSPDRGTLHARAAGTPSFHDDANDEEGPSAMDVDGAATTAPAPPAAPRVKNVLEWMSEDAPPELLPKLLSFCGSRRMTALSRVNRAWNAVMKDEFVWRVLCEDTHKWSDGNDVPLSWSRHYRLNPCVPIDYDTVDAALDAVSSGPRADVVENGVSQSVREQRETCRVLLHPGPHHLRRGLVADVARGAELTIELIGRSGAPRDPEHGMTWQRNYHECSSTATEGGGGRGDGGTARSRTYSTGEARRPSTPTLRQMFGSCGGRSATSPGTAAALALLDGSASSGGGAGDGEDDFGLFQSKRYSAALRETCLRGPRPSALLCLETRRPNEPAIRVRRGAMTLRGIRLLHYCEGTDIWNGNAAMQVQGVTASSGRGRIQVTTPNAFVFDCDISSLSGRGLVSIDGGVAEVRDCHVHGSAATGVYIGGHGSSARLTRTDVVENGLGNGREPGRGVARGHSGVYVEQGLADVRDCNISGNTLTGISAVSTEQARLRLVGSDVRANRTDQVEMPPAESGRGISSDNDISASGRGRPRSRHLADLVAAREAAGCGAGGPTTMPSSPQSPL